MRYEDVEPPHGDDPRDPSLYRREAYPVVERPTRAETDADEQDRGWSRGNYNDGGGL